MLSDAVEVKQVSEQVEQVEEATESKLGAELAPKDPSQMTTQEKTAEAVLFLRQALPAIRSMINNGTLTGTQAKRVLCALVESPLEQETPGFTTLEAQKVFNLACIIQNAKFVLFQGAPELLSEVEKQAALEKAEEEAKNEKASSEENENSAE